MQRHDAAAELSYVGPGKLDAEKLHAQLNAGIKRLNSQKAAKPKQIVDRAAAQLASQISAHNQQFQASQARTRRLEDELRGQTQLTADLVKRFTAFATDVGVVARQENMDRYADTLAWARRVIVKVTEERNQLLLERESQQLQKMQNGAANAKLEEQCDALRAEKEGLYNRVIELEKEQIRHEEELHGQGGAEQKLADLQERNKHLQQLLGDSKAETESLNSQIKSLNDVIERLREHSEQTSKQLLAKLQEQLSLNGQLQIRIQELELEASQCQMVARPSVGSRSESPKHSRPGRNADALQSQRARQIEYLKQQLQQMSRANTELHVSAQQNELELRLQQKNFEEYVNSVKQQASKILQYEIQNKALQMELRKTQKRFDAYKETAEKKLTESAQTAFGLQAQLEEAQKRCQDTHAQLSRIGQARQSFLRQQSENSSQTINAPLYAFDWIASETQPPDALWKASRQLVDMNLQLIRASAKSQSEFQLFAIQYLKQEINTQLRELKQQGPSPARERLGSKLMRDSVALKLESEAGRECISNKHVKSLIEENKLLLRRLDNESRISEQFKRERDSLARQLGALLRESQVSQRPASSPRLAGKKQSK